jgi:subtilisin family serine protease
MPRLEVCTPDSDLVPTTPSFDTLQLYCDTPPYGIGAWQVNDSPGGTGSGILLVDVEGNWKYDHEDLNLFIDSNLIDSCSGNSECADTTASGTLSQHGGGVIGILAAPDNGYGMTGICPDVDIGLLCVCNSYDVDSMGVEGLLEVVVDTIGPGDVVIIELHTAGPHCDYESCGDSVWGEPGFICLSWWPAISDLYLEIYEKGAIVVQAAGNGWENLDDTSIYGTVFDTAYGTDHSIMVGAGWPDGCTYAPPDTSLHEPLLTRCSYSNYGQRVNLHGHGCCVATAAWGFDIFGKGMPGGPPYNDPKQQYGYFAGTSSATPIVAGAVVLLNSVWYERHGYYLNADQVCKALFYTGTPQDSTSDSCNYTGHIGPLPHILGALGYAEDYFNPPIVEGAISVSGNVRIP